MMTDCLIKTNETPAQTSLKRDERLKNVRKAFSALKRLDGQIVLLIDDVITTGATVRECSNMILEAGAKKVIVVALAHSPLTKVTASGFESLLKNEVLKH